MNHQELIYSHLQQAVIQDEWIPAILDASLAEIYLFNKVQFIENCNTLFAFAIQSISQFANACAVFSFGVIHSRFSTLLSVLIQFIWLIHDLLYKFSINVIATSLCTAKCFGILSLYKTTRIYHCLESLPISTFSFENKMLFIFHKLLAWYLPSYQGISFHISIIKKSYFCYPCWSHEWHK